MVRYDTYIDSQTPYIGDIPSHWKMVQNKRVMHKEKRICDTYSGQNIISLTLNGAIVRDLGAGGKMPATFDGYQYVYPGELLMCLFDIDVTPRCVGRVNDEGLTSPAYSSFILHDNADLGYYYYYYLMLDHTKELLHLAKNLRHSLTEEQIGQIKVPLPPILEQQAIAKYLDEKIAYVDSIIAEAKASIEEYKSWKASIIYEAVTKGLDPNVEMKDSGIKWIGKMPVHWKCTKARQVSTFINGYAFQGDDFSVDGIYPVIRIGDIQDGKVDFLSCQSVSSNEGISSAKIEKNDILLAMSGATVGKVGYVDDVPLNSAYINQRVGIYRVKETPKFFFYLFSQPSYIEYALLNASGSAQPNISTEGAKNFFVPILPLDERERICQYLEKKCPYIEGIIVEKQSLISDLESYKKSLIFEAVTGKRKV